MITALKEAIEFAEQDGQALTAAGEAMVQRWRDALAEAESATPAAWRYRYNGQWYLSQSKSFAQNGFDLHPLYACPENARFAVSRDSLARHLAMLDNIRLQHIRSTIGLADDANNWREYLGRADDLLAALSADMASAPPRHSTERDEG